MLTSSGSRMPVSLTVAAVPDLLDNGPNLTYIFTDTQERKGYSGLAQVLAWAAIRAGLRSRPPSQWPWDFSLPPSNYSPLVTAL